VDNQEIETALRSMAGLLTLVAEATAKYLDKEIGPFVGSELREHRELAVAIREGLLTLDPLLAPLHTNPSEVQA
jgi:hypothetical protein